MKMTGRRKHLLVEGDDTLVSFGGGILLAAFARERGLRHYLLTKKAPVRERIYHIQNVNAYHRRLKSFMAPFNGVATKYLDNYLAWFRFYDLKKNEPLPEKRKDMMVSACARGADDTCRSLRESRFRLSS